jgi:RNA-directed DNA polymerase
MPLQDLTYILYYRGVGSYYQHWVIRKKSGGSRTIQAPRSSLYRVQKQLQEILLEWHTPKAPVHGFVRGHSVVTNAKPHLQARFVLNIDIHDFFPSIHFGRVRGLFLATPFNCSEEVATTLAQLVCLDGSLPVGAPTSPTIANMICLKLDGQLWSLAQRHSSWYTRYADDLTFSTRRRSFPEPLARLAGGGQVVLGDGLLRVLEANSFAPNPDKTRLQTQHDRQSVTGVIVNKRLNVDRRFVRRIRGMLHAWDKYGLEAAERHFPDCYGKDRHPGAAPHFLDVLKGRIAYLEMIRGSDDYLAARYRQRFRNLLEGRELNAGIDFSLDTSPVPVPPAGSPRREVLAVMFTDIVDSTALEAQLGDSAWGEVVTQHHALVRRVVRSHRGTDIKSLGDGWLATFRLPSQAVKAGNEIIERIERLDIQVRVGIHLSEIDSRDADIEGLGAAIAARVGAEAGPSELLVSQTVKDSLAGSGIRFADRGPRVLKNVPGVWYVYAPHPTGQSSRLIININHASADELEVLPGIGPRLADAIISFRQSHGPFSSIEHLERVPGVGPATVTRLSDRAEA